jgi:hypothetical protein
MADAVSGVSDLGAAVIHDPPPRWCSRPPDHQTQILRRAVSEMRPRDRDFRGQIIR